MTDYTISGVADAPIRLGTRISNARRDISARVHSAADTCAQAQGWTVTDSTGWLGMGGRIYRDPRFDKRRTVPRLARHNSGRDET